MSAELNGPKDKIVKKSERISVTETLALRNTDAEVKEKYIPIGGVSFNEGNSFLALGSDSLGKVVVRRVDELPAPIDPGQLAEGSDRLLDLSEFNDVQVLQTGITEMDVRAHRSIRTSPSMGITVNVENCETDEIGPHRIGEEQILQLFTGEKGGIVVFSGYDLPEDNALLFERGPENAKDAELLFIKPSGTDATVADSVDGVYLLIKKMNEEFETHAPLPLQQKALKELDQAMQYDEVDFHGSDVRAEIYRAHIISLARLAEKKDDPKYREQLGTELPMLDAKPLSRMFGARKTVEPRIVDGAIDELIRSEFTTDKVISSVSEKLDLSPKDTMVYHNLDLDTSKEQWRILAKNRFYRTDNHYSRKFVNDITKSIYAAKNPVEFADVEKLIHALFDSEYQKVRAAYSLKLGESTGEADFSERYGEREVLAMKGQLQLKLTELRKFALGK